LKTSKRDIWKQKNLKLWDICAIWVLLFRVFLGITRRYLFLWHVFMARFYGSLFIAKKQMRKTWVHDKIMGFSKHLAYLSTGP
jgi:hypothetical protein